MSVCILIHYGGRLRPKEVTVELSRVPAVGEYIRTTIYGPDGSDVDVRLAVVEVDHLDYRPPGNQAWLYCTVLSEVAR